MTAAAARPGAAIPPPQPAVLPAGLRDYALAAVGDTVAAHASSEPIAAELEFLLAHRRRAAGAGGDWRPGFLAYCADLGTKDEPLLLLAARLGLSPVETLAVELVAAVERDTMAGRAVAFVQAPLGGSRPTVGLVAAAFGALSEGDHDPAERILTGPAIGTGLLTLCGDGPLPEQTLRIPGAVCLALEGHDAPFPGAAIGLDQRSAVPLPPSTMREVRQHAAALSGVAGRVLVVRSGSPSEARSIAGALADALDARPAFLDFERTAGAGPWLLLRRLLPVFTCELGPGERRLVPAIPGYEGPTVVLLGPDGYIETAGGSALSWRVGVPPRAERAQLWHLALGDRALAATLAERHRHGSGRIAHLGRLARHQQAIGRRAAPEPDDVLHAAWSLEGGGLETLAEPLPDRVPPEALVLVPSLWEDLRYLLLRCRWRGELAEGLGASTQARYRPGVRALFVGPSGTGKTLAAGWLATELGLPLYRVDLASVTSKYIGETEKNLAQLLARAEQSEVVLLFDEADSMFGKRTDVKDANDRFANAQTNYLLQRIESFDGIALLTSNSRARFDGGFMRRLDLILEFALPGPDERRALWYSHLGRGHDCAPRQLNLLAARADMGGGHIRNAVLAAAVRAREESRRIGFADLLAGVGAEYRKLGKQLPAELRAGADGDGSTERP